jgi:hypothetical protein
LTIEATPTSIGGFGLKIMAKAVLSERDSGGHGEEGQPTSRSVLEIFPAWMQLYLRGIIYNNKVNDEAMDWIQSSLNRLSSC